MKKKIVGFFGGSFDPIHFGHIALAVQLMELNRLDEVLFCPAFCSPFKEETPPKASPEHRLAMLKLSLDLPQFKVTSVEVDRGGPSYTIDTIRAIKSKDVQFRLLLSEESAVHLERWKEAPKLFELAPPLTAPRERLISSTEIRDRIKKKLYCGHLIHHKVLEYIHAHNLYQI